MSTIARQRVFIWPTWVTGLLSGDHQCQWSAWFKAHFKHQRLERTGSDLTQWKAEHNAMVERRAQQLRADGWTVYLESQNKFWLRGKSGDLSGTPDIVAVRGEDALVVDCKSGARRDKDFWQVCIYMVAIPKTSVAVGGKRLTGEVCYQDHTLTIQPEECNQAKRDQIFEMLARVAGPSPLDAVPSERECGWCDIGPADCHVRVDASAKPQEVTCDLF